MKNPKYTGLSKIFEFQYATIHSRLWIDIKTDEKFLEVWGCHDGDENSVFLPMEELSVLHQLATRKYSQEDESYFVIEKAA